MIEFQPGIFFKDFYGNVIRRTTQVMSWTLLLWLIVCPLNVLYAFQDDLDIRINKVSIEGNEAYPEIVLREVIASEGV